MNPFDPVAGGAAREAAIQQAEDHAKAQFKKDALEALRHVATTTQRFTTDRVWAVLHQRGVPTPREPRVMGAIMRRGVGLGWIESTTEHVLSVKASNHRRPIRVWRSLISS